MIREVWLVRLPAEDRVLIRGSIKDITERKKAEEEILRSRRQSKPGRKYLRGILGEQSRHLRNPVHQSVVRNHLGRSVEELYKDPGAS